MRNRSHAVRRSAKWNSHWPLRPMWKLCLFWSHLNLWRCWGQHMRPATRAGNALCNDDGPWMPCILGLKMYFRILIKYEFSSCHLYFDYLLFKIFITFYTSYFFKFIVECIPIIYMCFYHFATNSFPLSNLRMCVVPPIISCFLCIYSFST